MTVLEQAGAIAVNLSVEPNRFLVVTARRDPNCWVFPKGTVEPGETNEDAALRELEEEAGVSGVPLGVVGDVTFSRENDELHVTYYVVHAYTEGESREGRELAWLPYDEARERLSFETARELLDKALRALGN